MKKQVKKIRMVLGMKRVSDDRPYAFRQASDKHTLYDRIHNVIFYRFPITRKSILLRKIKIIG